MFDCTIDQGEQDAETLECQRFTALQKTVASVHLSVRPSVTFANILHNFPLPQPNLMIFISSGSSRDSASFCFFRISILVPRRP